MNAQRIMDALDELLSREALVARSGSGTRVREVQARIAPLVAALAKASNAPGASGLTAGLAALAEKRRRNREIMEQASARLKVEIGERSAAIGRLRRVRPAYFGQNVPQRLNAST